MFGKFRSLPTTLVFIAILGVAFGKRQILGKDSPVTLHWSTITNLQSNASQFMNVLKQLRNEIRIRKALYPGADLKAEFGPLLANKKGAIRQCRDRLASFAEVLEGILDEYKKLEAELNISSFRDGQRATSSGIRQTIGEFISWYSVNQGY